MLAENIMIAAGLLIIFELLCQWSLRYSIRQWTAERDADLRKYERALELCDPNKIIPPEWVSDTTYMVEFRQNWAELRQEVEKLKLASFPGGAFGGWRDSYNEAQHNAECICLGLLFGTAVYQTLLKTQLHKR